MTALSGEDLSAVFFGSEPSLGSLDDTRTLPEDPFYPGIVKSHLI